MKYAIIIPDGCADEPQDSLGGKTPLQAARLPAMDAVARPGVVGRGNHTPASLPAGSDTANLSLLGYDPLHYFTGRAPLEAAAQGIELGPGDWAVRCNLVTIEDQIMRDFTAGHVSTEEATALLASLQEKTGSAKLRFLPGVSYRNLLLVHSAAFTSDTRTTAAARPHRSVHRRRLSARAGQQSSGRIDERQRGSLRRPSRQPGTAEGRQAAGNERLALGPRQRAAAGAVREALRRTRGDDYRGRSLARAGPFDRLAADRRARRDRLSRHRLRGQGPGGCRGAARTTTWFAFTSRRPTRPRTKAAPMQRSRHWNRSTGTSSGRCSRPCRAIQTGGSWFRRTTPRHYGPRRTATATCRSRSRAAALRGMSSRPTTIRRRPVPTSTFPKAGK